MGLQQYFDNKRIKKMMKLTDKIVTQHTQVSNIEDSAFVTQTQQFKDRLKNGENEEQVQIEAYALARKAQNVY
ncbi:hypothetical protein G3M54_00035 [Bacillus megaterium NBRC 15308 = ATCC 14581]|nr:hypothetical protein [Priestia megaterium NBRC 15308 = ATCC 14581]